MLNELFPFSPLSALSERPTPFGLLEYFKNWVTYYPTGWATMLAVNVLAEGHKGGVKVVGVGGNKKRLWKAFNSTSYSL